MDDQKREKANELHREITDLKRTVHNIEQFDVVVMTGSTNLKAEKTIHSKIHKLVLDDYRKRLQKTVKEYEEL